MKISIPSFLFFIGICFFSCSDEENNDQTIENPEIEEKHETFISHEMQTILNMIDTYKTTIPFKKLIPYNIQHCTETISQDELTILENMTSISIKIDSGYSFSSTLFSRIETIVDDTQAASLGIEAGTYYVTCKYASHELITNGIKPFIFYVEGDAMGINPENLSEIGYHVEEIVPNELYDLTTYIWGLASCSTSNCTYSEWIPRIAGEAAGFVLANDFLNNLQWRYYYVQ